MTMFTCSVKHRNPHAAGKTGIGQVTFLSSLLWTGLCSFALAQETATAPSLAQSSAQPARSVTSPQNLNALITAANPAWRDLTSAQQLSLKPLAEHWNTLEETHKRKWIAIAANYPILTPPEQVRMHSRMTEWASLSKQQRAQARLNFTQSKQHTPTQKTATWEAYQALSPEEKKKLATQAPKKTASIATAAKRPPSEKLVVVPEPKKSASGIIQIAPIKHQMVNRYTLLPNSPQQAASAATSQK